MQTANNNQTPDESHNSHPPHPSPLKQRCDALGLFMPVENPTPEILIPILEVKLQHLKTQRPPKSDRFDTQEEWMAAYENVRQFYFHVQAIAAAKPEQKAILLQTLPEEISAADSAPNLRRKAADKDVQSSIFNDQSSMTPGPNPQSEIRNPQPPLPAPGTLRAALEASAEPPSPLDQLPPEHQLELYEMLQQFSQTYIVETLAKPAPAGWGLKTSARSLTRFKERYDQTEKTRLHQLNHRAILKAAAHAQALLSSETATDEQILAATDRLLKLRLLESAEQGDTKELRALYQTQLQREKLTLAQNRLAYLTTKQAGRAPSSNPKPSTFQNATTPTNAANPSPSPRGEGRGEGPSSSQQPDHQPTAPIPEKSEIPNSLPPNPHSTIRLANCRPPTNPPLPKNNPNPQGLALDGENHPGAGFARSHEITNSLFDRHHRLGVGRGRGRREKAILRAARLHDQV